MVSSSGETANRHRAASPRPNLNISVISRMTGRQDSACA